MLYHLEKLRNSGLKLALVHIPESINDLNVYGDEIIQRVVYKHKNEILNHPAFIQQEAESPHVYPQPDIQVKDMSRDYANPGQAV